MSEANGWDIRACYFCDFEWGKCVCEFPEEDPEAKDGFEFNGVWITRPNVDESGRFFVNPVLYYGDHYKAFCQKLEAEGRAHE